ncbi:uncharacterized protein TNIN_272611 [Trichonephila inaurata madagascariensis]|uniref:Uncharacterized protein n=1 Tax=Trichonephila inaurata madagascariensis TaxID=2747483 RepID=A0A8X6IM93_9ARAC|nr:uncharacterized protein TNIN_272611 [Trichonephila inaurata madagascariensis]
MPSRNKRQHERQRNIGKVEHIGVSGHKRNMISSGSRNEEQTRIFFLGDLTLIMQLDRGKLRHVSGCCAGYQVSEAKGPPYGSSMYSRDKYHDTINGEALRSPLNDVEETFHEDILMKEIMKQEAEPSKSPKIEHKVPTRAHQNHQRWPSAAENSCPDILKNGHNYVKSPKLVRSTIVPYGWLQFHHFRNRCEHRRHQPKFFAQRESASGLNTLHTPLTLNRRRPLAETRGCSDDGLRSFSRRPDFGKDKDNCHSPASQTSRRNGEPILAGHTGWPFFMTLQEN